MITLQERAGRFAALGDPVRLRITDLLSLGDRAPSELQRALGVSSNLLAHHLKTLERVGMVTRIHSEADRRRSYVRLDPSALEDLGPSAAAAARRVVFVCTANSARSQLAEALWRDRSGIPAASAGTRPAAAVAAGALDAARRHGLRVADAPPKALRDILRVDDFIVTVCDAAHESLDAEQQLHWSVSDPVATGTARAFDSTVEELTRRIDALAPRLQPVR